MYVSLEYLFLQRKCTDVHGGFQKKSPVVYLSAKTWLNVSKSLYFSNL